MNIQLNEPVINGRA